jgi:hypothetical protein
MLHDKHMNMLKFLIDNIFVMFGGRVFNRQSAYKLLLQGLLKKNEKKLGRPYNFTFRYIDDVLSLNNSRFGDLVDHIYPIELEIKDTTDTDRSASYLDPLLETLYQGNPDRKHKLWNIVSIERYILHMQVLLECCYI